MTVTLPEPMASPLALMMAPPKLAVLSSKLVSVTVRTPPQLLSMAPPRVKTPEPSPVPTPCCVGVVLKPSSMVRPPAVRPVITTCTTFSTYTTSVRAMVPTVRTGPAQLGVVQPAALPRLPSSTGLETPAAGSMVTGAPGDVAGVPMVQLPT